MDQLPELNETPTPREIALAWWNAMTVNEKMYYIQKFYPERNPFTITKRDIEYMKSTPLHMANKLIITQNDRENG